MSILDLQGLSAPEQKGPPPGSRQSNGCNNTAESALSLLCTL